MNNVEFVKNNYDSINNWVIYAEAKNTALIGANVAILAVNDKLYSVFESNNVIVFLFWLGILFYVVSFFPFYNFVSFNTKRKESNLIFFRDIAFLSCDEYLAKLSEKYDIDYKKEAKRELLRDYAQEIVINSRIVVYKLKMCKIGIFFSLCYIVCVFATVLLGKT